MINRKLYKSTKNLLLKNKSSISIIRNFTINNEKLNYNINSNSNSNNNNNNDENNKDENNEKSQQQNQKPKMEWRPTLNIKTRRVLINTPIPRFTNGHIEQQPHPNPQPYTKNKKRTPIKNNLKETKSLLDIIRDENIHESLDVYIKNLQKGSIKLEEAIEFYHLNEYKRLFNDPTVYNSFLEYFSKNSKVYFDRLLKRFDFSMNLSTMTKFTEEQLKEIESDEIDQQESGVKLEDQPEVEIEEEEQKEDNDDDDDDNNQLKEEPSLKEKEINGGNQKNNIFQFRPTSCTFRIIIEHFYEIGDVKLIRRWLKIYKMVTKGSNIEKGINDTVLFKILYKANLKCKSTKEAIRLYNLLLKKPIKNNDTLIQLLQYFHEIKEYKFAKFLVYYYFEHIPKQYLMDPVICTDFYIGLYHESESLFNKKSIEEESTTTTATTTATATATTTNTNTTTNNGEYDDGNSKPLKIKNFKYRNYYVSSIFNKEQNKKDSLKFSYIEFLLKIENKFIQRIDSKTTIKPKVDESEENQSGTSGLKVSTNNKESTRYIIKFYTELFKKLLEKDEIEIANTIFRYFLEKYKPNKEMVEQFLLYSIKKEEINNICPLVKRIYENRQLLETDFEFAIIDLFNRHKETMKLLDFFELLKKNTSTKILVRKIAKIVVFSEINSYNQVVNSMKHFLKDFKHCAETTNSIMYLFLTLERYDLALQWYGERISTFDIVPNDMTIMHFMRYHDRLQINNKQFNQFWESRLEAHTVLNYGQIKKRHEQLQERIDKIKQKNQQLVSQENSINGENTNTNDNEFEIDDNEVEKEEKEKEEEDDDDDDEDDESNHDFIEEKGKLIGYKKILSNQLILLDRYTLMGKLKIEIEKNLELPKESYDFTLERYLNAMNVNQVFNELKDQFKSGVIKNGITFTKAILFLQEQDQNKYLELIENHSNPTIDAIIFSDEFYANLIKRDLEYGLNKMSVQNPYLWRRSSKIWNAVIVGLLNYGQFKLALSVINAATKLNKRLVSSEIQDHIENPGKWKDIYDDKIHNLIKDNFQFHHEYIHPIEREHIQQREREKSREKQQEGSSSKKIKKSKAKSKSKSNTTSTVQNTTSTSSTVSNTTSTTTTTTTTVSTVSNLSTLSNQPKPSLFKSKNSSYSLMGNYNNNDGNNIHDIIDSIIESQSPKTKLSFKSLSSKMSSSNMEDKDNGLLNDDIPKEIKTKSKSSSFKSLSSKMSSSSSSIIESEENDSILKESKNDRLNNEVILPNSSPSSSSSSSSSKNGSIPKESKNDRSNNEVILPNMEDKVNNGIPKESKNKNADRYNNEVILPN